jgi:hypothetical protein
MIRPTFHRLALAAVVLATLAGCTPGTVANGTLEASIALARDQFAGRNAPDAPELTTVQKVELAQQIFPTGTLVLATTLIGGEETVLFAAARNRGVDILASAGNQTVALADGVLLNTRGLSYDLLGSDSTGSRRLIAARAEGTSRRLHELATVDLSGDRQVYDCAVAPFGPETITLPTGRSQPTTLVIENCRNDAENFVNQYWVGPDGYVWASRQWAGRNYGHLAFATIRR